ncbi:hypothetical protein BD779DRAFT_1553564 [Infundibulicybe gibba]|nr:hypothetical protein BD779DRAFT_1553564 [Infundibulicybe gibba]
MSGEMSSSWRYLNSASTRLSSLKSYVSVTDGRRSRPNTPTTPTGTEGKHGWRAWAGDKIKTRKGHNRGEAPDREAVELFPGWAVRKPREVAHRDLGVSADDIDIDIYVSGYASSCRAPEFASRSQRAFIRLAKGFASLPKLASEAIEAAPESLPPIKLSPSTEELLKSVKLPPRPTEITEASEIEALERQFQRANPDIGDDPSPASSRSSLDMESPASSSSQPSTQRPQTPLHANLESRLRPFWSSALSARKIRLYVFAYPYQDDLPRDNRKIMQTSVPLAAMDVSTAIDGSFDARFRVSWKTFAEHLMTSDEPSQGAPREQALVLCATILPPSTQLSPTPPTFSSSRESNPSSTIRVNITNCPIRVISDIDDTVKHSGVLSGARAVFHNVFVKELRDIIIPGMGEWYTSMWDRGVRFHYVSNGPFELLPVINEFFAVSKLPPGSIKLRSYGGRSLFNGLLSAPAARKRGGVLEVLNSLPDSRFFLIGDTGEQDLELYAEIAIERPDQILAVFVRDTGTTEPIPDPTGWSSIGPFSSRSSTQSSQRPPLPRLNTSGSGSLTGSPLSSEPEGLAKSDPVQRSNGFASRTASLMSTSSVTSVSSKMTETERKRNELQMRVYRARTLMPGHVPLRIFKKASECVEADEILSKACP